MRAPLKAAAATWALNVIIIIIIIIYSQIVQVLSTLGI